MIYSLIMSLCVGFSAQALTPEVDEAVRESVAAFFSDYGRTADLNTLNYYSEPKLNGQKWSAETSIWAEQGFTDKWGWFICKTELSVGADGALTDFGSDCVYDF